MRKITSLMALLLAVFTTAMAQIDISKEYRVKDVASGNYMNASNYDAHPTGPLGGVNFAAKAESDDQVFTFEADGTNYKLKTKSGKYIFCQSWNVDALEQGSALTFVDNGDGTYYIKNGGNYFKVEYVSGKPVATIDGQQVDQAEVSGYFPYCDAAYGAAAKFELEVVETVVEPEPEVPATPVVITEVAQLSNAKCYTLVSSDTGRGGMYALADKVDMCGVTYSAGSDDCHKVERNAADPKQQFAFVEYEGKHYLYSVSEKKFVMKSGNTNALVGEAPYEFVTVEKVGENTFALKANDTHYFTASPGWCSNPSRATCIQSTLTSQSESDGWDAGAWFTITEAGEFNPEEALAMLTPAAPATPLEFVKANPVLESEVTSLSSITLTFNKEIASVDTTPGMFWFVNADMTNMYDAEVQINATDAKTLTITLAEEIKEAGTYIAMFSQGALVAADGTSNETAVEMAWTVKPEVPATPIELVKANPVLESEVTSLSSITLTFNKEIASVDTTPGMFWFVNADMTNMYDAEVQINATDAKTLTITLAEEIKEAGTYIAMFSQGALVAADGTSNETAVELAWTVKPEVVEPEPTELELVKANPALETEVSSLGSITLTFNKEIASVTLNESTFYFMATDFSKVFTTADVQVNATDAKSVTLTLPEVITAEGEYVAMLMNGAVVATDGTSNQGIIELAWTVKAAPAVEPLQLVSIDPANGSELSSVTKFTLTFNKPVTLKNAEGATLHANGGSTTLQVLVSETDAKEVVLAADKEITISGSYELKVAEGTLEDADGGLNEALTFTYEVESSNNTLTVVKTDPDVNVPQESLKHVILTFNTEVMDYDTHATVNVTDESGAVVATGMMDFTDIYEEVLISFNKEITTPGKYTVTVPENTIFGYGTYNPEINLTYTIGAEPTTGATLEPVSVDPAEPYWWDAMEDIEYIAINFPEEITYNAEKPVTVTFNAVENVEVSVAVSADDAKQLVVTFPENLKIGEYVVNVPEGAVVAVSGATCNPALTYTYNVDYAYNTFEPTSITPAAGKVESLKEIVLDFGPNDYPGTNGIDKEATFELTNAVGEVVATGKLDYFGYRGAVVTLDKEITELGLYTITIPEGVIWNSKVDGTSDRGVHKGARCNPTIELVYSIGEAATVTEVTPVPGHYEEIPSEISVTFSKEIGSVVYIILRNENTGMRGYYFAEDEYTVDGSKLSFTLPADMIKYAAGATVQMQVLDKDGFPVTYAASEDEMVEGFVMLQYTATAKSDLFVAKSVDPAEGEVEELSVLKVTFENLKATEGMSYVGGFDETKVVEVLDAEGNQVATAAMEVVNTVYREEWEGEVYEYESPSLVAQFTLNNTITEPGTYTFVIPEATVYNEGFYPEAEDLGVDWGAIYNPEVRYTYTIAGEAEVSYEPLHNGTKERTDRNITAVKLSSVLGDNEYSLTATEQSQDFVDATAVATFKVVAGEELTAEVKHAGEWVHHAVYVDVDANGFTGGIEEGSEWKPAGDLMAYAFYNNGGSSDEYGYNSVGTSLAGQDRHMPAIPAFKAPEQPGTYRMRFVQTWCSIDPAGDNDGKFGDFKSNGDQIVDVILEVTDATGIGAISVDGNNDVYSLDGRKVNVKMGKKLNKGIYIVNGKKVYVK